MSFRETFGALSVVFGMVSYGIYLRQLFQGVIKPHMFTWIIWCILMAIGFAAQYAEHAGPGAWNLGFSVIIVFLIAVISFFHGEKGITRSDWIAFIAALSAIPVWRATHDPFWAVVMISLIDATAFLPTIRKTWMKPHEESGAAFAAGVAQYGLSIFAIEKGAFVTAIYPAVIMMMNIVVVSVILYRRKALA